MFKLAGRILASKTLAYVTGFYDGRGDGSVIVSQLLYYSFVLVFSPILDGSHTSGVLNYSVVVVLDLQRE